LLAVAARFLAGWGMKVLGLGLWARAVGLGLMGLVFGKPWDKSLWFLDPLGQAVLVVGLGVGLLILIGAAAFGKGEKTHPAHTLWFVGAALFYEGCLMPNLLGIGGIELFGFVVPWAIWALAGALVFEGIFFFKTGPVTALADGAAAVCLGVCRYYTGSVLTMLLLCVIFCLERLVLHRMFCNRGLKRVKYNRR